MNLPDMKTLLEAPEVREAFQQALADALTEKEAELAKAKEALTEEKAVLARNAFLQQKALLQKVALFEKKLAEHYDNQYRTHVKNLSETVYKFFEAPIKNIQESVRNEALANSKAAKLEEAFSKAVRLLAPHMDISELAASNADEIAKLRAQLNEALAEANKLRQADQSKDIALYVATESAKLNDTDRAIMTEAFKKVKVTSLTEAAATFQKLLAAIDEKKVNSVVESVQTVIGNSPNAETRRTALKEAAKVIVTPKKTEPTKSPLAYDIASATSV